MGDISVQSAKTQKGGTERKKSVSSKSTPELSQAVDSPVKQVLYLQSTLGNRAVTRLIQSGALQAKLKIGNPNDIYEKEADQMADQVMSMKDSSSVQRQKTEEEEGVQPRLQRQPEEEEKEESAVGRVREKLTVGSPGDVYEQEADRVAEAISSRGGISDLSNMTPVQQKLLSSVDPRALGSLSEKNIWPMVSKDTVGSKRLTVNRKNDSPQRNSGSVSANIENRILQSKGKGNQLPQPMQNYMAIQAGYDFSNVRVKADSEAAELNTALGARAFANGSDIWLGRGEKVTDVKLMAHELTHVVQQGGAKRLQTRSDTLSRTLASKGFMPKFMQTLTTYPQSNSALFQKGILQFAKENPPDRMTALQARILEGSRSGMPNLRESAQTLRGCIPSCNPTGSKQAATPVNPTFSSTAFNKGTGGNVTLSAGATHARLRSPAYTPSGTVRASGGNNAGAKDWEAGFVQTVHGFNVTGYYKNAPPNHGRFQWSLSGRHRDADPNATSGGPWYDPDNKNSTCHTSFTKTNSSVNVSIWDRPSFPFSWTTPKKKNKQGKLDRTDGKVNFDLWMIARKKTSPNTIHYMNWATWEIDWSSQLNFASTGARTAKNISGKLTVTGSGKKKGSNTPVLGGTVALRAVSSTWL